MTNPTSSLPLLPRLPARLLPRLPARLLALTAWLLTGSMPGQAGVTPATATQPGVTVGRVVPELQVKEWCHGQPVKVRGRGRSGIVVVVFPAGDDDGKDLLAGLQAVAQKFKDQRVSIAVVVQKALATDAAGVAVAVDLKQQTATTWLGSSKPPQAFVINYLGLCSWRGRPNRGLRTALHRDIAIGKDRQLLTRYRQQSSALGTAEARKDWKTMDEISKGLIDIGARNALPWTTRFRAHAGIKKDPKTARAVVSAALKDLAYRPNQMVKFANECLLKDEKNTYYQQVALMALTPIAHQERKNVDVQIAYARALAGCGNVKHAKAVAQKLPAIMGEDRARLRRWADEMTTTKHPKAFAEPALAAINRAISLGGANRDLLMIKFRVLDRCAGDSQRAMRVGEQIIYSMRENNGSLNSFAWDLLTEPPYKGRFSKLALIASNTMEKNGQSVSYYMLDTIALAKFENGFIDEAISYQQRAIDGGGKGDQEYIDRMNMYKRARRERDARRNQKKAASRGSQAGKKK